VILYHGTTARRAKQIAAEGFQPRKPSRRVWFAERRGYAQGRAKTQARRRHDRPAVLVCEVDLALLRQRLGTRRLVHRGGVVAVNGHVPVSVLRSFPGYDIPASPDELASWVNRILGLKSYKGASRRHPGIERLSSWMAHRMASQPGSNVAPAELLEMAQRWLPEFFDGVEVDRERLKVRRKVTTIALKVEAPPPEEDAVEMALECLDDDRPNRRVRGLSILADMADPDLFDWCVMLLEDEARSVRLKALQTMAQCEDGDADVIEPHASSEDKRIRAAALAALARHGGRSALRWLKRGLRDPEPCVRVRTARMLSRLDPERHRSTFELALYDPNADVRRTARKLVAGKGYARPKW